jgi:hypothetical protein
MIAQVSVDSRKMGGIRAMKNMCSKFTRWGCDIGRIPGHKRSRTARLRRWRSRKTQRDWTVDRVPNLHGKPAKSTGGE